MSRKKGDRDKVAVKRRRSKSLRERFQRHAQAVTFAEAGLHEEARELLRRDLAQKAKVLVVGHEETFSQKLQAYAVGFAARMGCEIVALNISLVRPEFPEQGPYRDMICEQFKKRCLEKISPFRQACQEKGISLSHLVKFGEVEECIREACDELRRVEFVLTDPESCPAQGKAAVPVFCLAR